MNFFIYLWVLCLAACVSGTSKIDVSESESQASQPAAGRWIGFFWFHDQPVKVPVTMDLVRSGPRHYQAVFRFSQGSWDSSEYSSLWFPSVVFQAGENSLVFTGDSKGLKVSKVNWKSRKLLVGDLLDKEGDNPKKGRFLLLPRNRYSLSQINTLIESIVQDAPVKRELAGEYHGYCDGTSTRVRVRGGKWGSSVPSTRLFGDFKVQVEWASRGPACSNQGYCLDEFYPEGNYDFWDLELVLSDGLKKRVCSVSGNGLSCGKICYLEKSKEHFVLQVPDKRKRSPNLSLETAVGKKAPGVFLPVGEWYGYLYIDKRDLYHPIRINVKPDNNGMKVVATLFFGGFKSREFIVHRFLSVPAILDGQVLNGEGEANLKIDNAVGDFMAGRWVSKSYGVAGRFEVIKGQVPFLSKDYELVKPLSGAWVGSDSSVDLLVFANRSESEGDFYPGILTGYSRGEKGLGAVVAGSFNLYNGHLALRWEDKRISFGRFEGGALRLSLSREFQEGVVLKPELAIIYRPK